MFFIERAAKQFDILEAEPVSRGGGLLNFRGAGHGSGCLAAQEAFDFGGGNQRAAADLNDAYFAEAGVLVERRAADADAAAEVFHSIGQRSFDAVVR